MFGTILWARGKGSFQIRPFLETLDLEILEIRENPHTVENKAESDHSRDILDEIPEILEILEIPPVEYHWGQNYYIT